MIQQQDFTLRPYRHSDAKAVVQVVNSAAAQTIGAQRAVVDSVGNVRLSRYVPVSSEKVVALNVRSEVVGYAYLANVEQHIVYEAGGAVHPDYWGQGIGSMLLDWAERRAQALSNYAPTGVRTVLQANMYASEQGTIALFTQHGYAKMREWLHLVIELDAEPGLSLPPNGLHLRVMDFDRDWEIVGPALDEAFADHWGAISLPEVEIMAADEPEAEAVAEDDSYSNAPGFCFLVMDQATVAGGVLCNRKWVERGDTGRVGSLFVRPRYRRQGVGRVLMVQAFRAFWQHGIRRVVTDTDAQSFSAAPAFYTRLGMHEYRREFLYEKTIRAGREVRRLSV